MTVCDQLCSCLVQLCTDTVQYVYGVYVSSVQLVCKWLWFKMAMCVCNTDLKNAETDE